MNDTLLRRLYRGDVYPAEDMGKHVSPAERQCEYDIEQERQYFKKILSPEDLEHLEKLDELHSISERHYGFENFTTGFRLGAMLMMETLSPDNN